MKKECKNCRWRTFPNFWGYEECWRHHNCYERENGGKIYQEFVGKLEKDIDQNKNNDCSYYEEKRWWRKLFIKP